MFGTLISTDIEQGILKYVENPDPAAAVSRNLRDKIHVSCISCRSRKVRCSGGRERCQRCVAMGLECVYPESQGRTKRQKNNQNHRASPRFNANVQIQPVDDETEAGSQNEQLKYGEDLSLDNLNNSTFDDSCIDESLFSPWTTDTPLQHSLDGTSSSGSSLTSTSAIDLTASRSGSSARGRSTTAVTPCQFPGSLMASKSLMSLLGPSGTDSAGDMDFWDRPYSANSEMACSTDADGYSAVGTTSESLFPKLSGRKHAESDNCFCLPKSISFLERLVSRSTSLENRIDLLLADVRYSIEALATFIACERCATRIEQNMLLAMAARHISVMCRKGANCVKVMNLRGFDDTKSSQQGTDLDGSSGTVDISVSTYSVNPREKLHLLKNLVALQIVDFQQQINTLKSRYRSRSNQCQSDTLVEAEKHLKLAQATISSRS